MVRAYHFLAIVQACFVVFSICVAVSAEENACTDASACSELDDASGAKQESIGDESRDNVSSPFAFMKAFNKLGTSWSHVIGEYISVVKGADGVDLKGDIYAQGMSEGLISLQSMVQEAASASKEDELAWSFRTTPLVDFRKSIDDVLLAFLRWSVVDRHSEDDDSCQLVGGMNQYPSSSADDDGENDINVSKAFRRLKAYVHWMQSVAADLAEPPLTYESIAPSLSIFSIHVAHDSCGRLIWWVNLGKTDLSVFKSQSSRETTRLFVWVAHLLFLDEGAQTKGLLVIDDMAKISFWDYMTMLPIQVGISVDRFLISVTPLKAKNVVLMHLPKWADVGYGLLSWFLTAKMKSRVTMVANGEENETLLKVTGGSEYMPTGFGNFGGELQTDIIGSMHQEEVLSV